MGPTWLQVSPDTHSTPLGTRRFRSSTSVHPPIHITVRPSSVHRAHASPLSPERQHLPFEGPPSLLLLFHTLICPSLQVRDAVPWRFSLPHRPVQDPRPPPSTNHSSPGRERKPSRHLASVLSRQCYHLRLPPLDSSFVHKTDRPSLVSLSTCDCAQQTPER